MRKQIHRAHDSIAERVQALVREHLDVPATEVTLDASLIDDLGADSLDVVELSMALEEEFGLQLADAELEQLRVVGDLVLYIEGRVQGAA